MNIGYSKAIFFSDNLKSVVSVFDDFSRSSSESEEEQIYVEEEDTEAALLLGEMARKMLPLVLITALILLSVAGASRFTRGSVPVSRAGRIYCVATNAVGYDNQIFMWNL